MTLLPIPTHRFVRVNGLIWVKHLVIIKFNFPSHQVSELQNEGRECILITSGAVAFGKQKLAQEVMMSMSMRETIQQNNTKEEIASLMAKSLKKPNAAVGQSGLQALYETMFRNYGILVGQVGDRDIIYL